jgi:phosphate starvation-inducible membrane PsiE
MLVVQPLLISTGRAQLHRTIGKLSYVLGPLVIISLFMIGKEGYWHGMRQNIPMTESLATMVLDIRGFICFAMFWALAMINRKNSHAHMRYMIATGILAIGPGVGRGLIIELGFSFHAALTITDGVELAIPAVCLAYDIYKKKDYRPWLTITIVMLISFILWQVKYSDAWQTFAAKYAAWFY